MANNSLETRGFMKILLGEDDPLAAQVIEIMAGKAGIIVERAANGLDAADRVAASPPDHFDAVLLDMRMPILDGREAARRIRDLPCARGAVPIYAMSSSETELLRHPWATWLFDGHLTKPLKQSDLQALLRDHSRKSSGGQEKPVHRRYHDAVVERIENGMREIEDSVARADCRKAGDAAKRLRLGLLGLAPEDLIRALHLFQLSQVHGRGEKEPLEDLRQCFVTARTLLMAA